MYLEDLVAEDLPAIPWNLRSRILRAVESRLSTRPAQYGTRLRRSLASLWKLRVGDYRIVYEIGGKTVRIWTIAHRKKVYSEAESRWRSTR